MMSESCVECGAVGSIIADSHGGHEQMVCDQCGYVLQQTSFTSAPQEDTGWMNVGSQFNFASHNLPGDMKKCSNSSQQLAEGLTVGNSKIKDICAALHLSSETQKEVIALYQCVFDHPKFHRKRIDNKLLLATCCVYIVCRRHDHLVTMNQFLVLSGSDRHTFNHHFVDIKRHLDIEIPLLSIEDVVPSVCDTFKMTREEKEVVLELVQLSQTMWPDGGPGHELIIISCGYLVWQSSSFVERRNISLAKFLQKYPKHSKYCKQSLNSTLKVIKDTLHAMASKIPWISSSVDVKFIARYIPDILRYQNSLAVESCVKTRKRKRSGTDGNETEKYTCDSKVMAALDNPELGSEDLSLAEIRDYIRTDEEVKSWIATKEKVESFSNSSQ